MPQRLAKYVPTTGFLANTEHFWRTHIVLTLTVAFALYHIRKRIMKYELFQSKKWLFAAYRHFGLVLWCLMFQHCQCLSFRCFLQLKTSSTSTGSLINISICYGTLCLIVSLGLTFPFLMHFCRIDVTLLFPFLKKSLKSLFYISIMIKHLILLGFCHATFFNNPIAHSLSLILVTSIHIFLLLSVKSCYKSKALMTTVLLKSISYLCLHILLFLYEQYLPGVDP